jgi:hypothetical protein
MSPIVALLLLGAAAVVGLNPPSGPTRLALVHQAEALVLQADQTADLYAAHALAANALELAQRASSAGPGENRDLLSVVRTRLDEIDRVFPVDSAMAVRLGQSGGDVVDLAVGDDALYTLDVVESSVRVFGLAGRDQQPTPDTLLTRAGATVAGSPRQLAAPVAIHYVAGKLSDPGLLAIVDEARSVVQVGRDRIVSARPYQSSRGWRELGALGGDSDGHLFVLDSGARQLLEYPLQNQRLVDSPRLVLDDASAPGLAFERAAEIVGLDNQVYMRMDDGSLRRFDAQGSDSSVVVRPPDGRPVSVIGIASDRAGGLYLADPTNARVLHTTADGALLRQFRNPALAGVRQIHLSRDGRHLYGLVASGVMVFDLP